MLTTGLLARELVSVAPDPQAALGEKANTRRWERFSLLPLYALPSAARLKKTLQLPHVRAP